MHGFDNVRIAFACCFVLLMTIMNPVICKAEVKGKQSDVSYENRNVIKARTYTSGDDVAIFTVELYNEQYVFSVLYQTDTDWKTSVAFFMTYAEIKEGYINAPYNILMAQTMGKNTGIIYGDYPSVYSYGIADGKEMVLNEWVNNRIYEMPDKEGREFYGWIEEIITDFKTVARNNPTEKDVVIGFSVPEDHSFIEEYSESRGDYIFENSDKEKIEESKLKALSDEELRIALNEIYARHGRGFEAKDLQSYFNAKSWYNKVYDPEEFDKIQDEIFNDYEKHNRDLIMRIIEERRLGKAQSNKL